MTATTETFWRRGMTVQLDHQDGSETTLRLSVSTIVGSAITIISAIIAGIVIWIFGLQATLQGVQMQQAVDQQVITNIQVSNAKTTALLEDIRNDQIRRQNKETNGRH